MFALYSKHNVQDAKLDSSRGIDTVFACDKVYNLYSIANQLKRIFDPVTSLVSRARRQEVHFTECNHRTLTFKGAQDPVNVRSIRVSDKADRITRVFRRNICQHLPHLRILWKSYNNIVLNLRQAHLESLLQSVYELCYEKNADFHVFFS